jgi:hypothetical protein
MSSWVVVAAVAGIVTVAASVVGVSTLAVMARARSRLARDRAEIRSHQGAVDTYATTRHISESLAAAAPPPESYIEVPMNRETAERIAQELRSLADTLEQRAGVRLPHRSSG